MAGGRRVQTWFGVALLLAGLALVGWYCWQTFGTTWASRRDHAEINQQLEQQWDQGEATAQTEFGSASAIVRIPAFGDDYVVPLIEGTSDEALAAGIGHVDGTAGPGEPGNFAVAGHRITHGEPFRDLPELEVGDEVVVETAAATYTYVLTTSGDALEVPFTASWVLDPLPVNPDPDGIQPTGGPALMTLTTCAELFHTDERLVAFASLVDTVPK